MEITKIKRIGNTNRYHVYVDEQWYGIFLDEILVKYHISTSKIFDEDEFSQIKKENDKKVSFDMAVSYLEKYSVSEKGLKDYLKRKNFSDETIEDVVAKLKEYNMINDEVFAKNYFESLSATQGKRTIANKLRGKGISKEIIDELLESIDDEDEVEKAIKLVEKFVKNRQIDTKIKQKCLAHLIYKGYDYSVAQRAIKIAFENIGENNDWF